ncbi:MAG: hypothetical protein HY326_00325 [Chloroflexi bacterium]|nr:hypothetical protein [Chloroflexota bacterium]
MLSYHLIRLFGWLIRHIPESLGYALFNAVGDLVYLSSPESRRSVMANLAHVMGPDPDPSAVRQNARRIFQLQAKNYFDLFRIPYLSPDQIWQRLDMVGLEYIAQLREHNTGVVVVGGHTGNFDLLMQATTLLKFHLTVAAEHFQPEALFRFVTESRSSNGVTLVEVGSNTPVLSLFRALRKKDYVAVTLDRDVSGNVTPVPFCGYLADLPDGFAEMAVRAKVPVLFAFPRRKPDNTFEIYLEPPYFPNPDRRHDIEVRTIHQLMLAHFERYLRRFPDQWVIFRPVWRREG